MVIVQIPMKDLIISAAKIFLDKYIAGIWNRKIYQRIFYL